MNAPAVQRDAIKFNKAYKGKPVIIKGCSDQKIPLSAYSVLLEKLQHQAKSIMFGEACSSVPIYKSLKKSN